MAVWVLLSLIVLVSLVVLRWLLNDRYFFFNATPWAPSDLLYSFSDGEVKVGFFLLIV